MVGQTIANYRITSLLAKERGRTLYVAEDVQHDRALAIQVWQRSPPENPRLPIDTGANALAHPNIAQVLEAGLSDGAQPYRVMELLDGETLAARLRVQACVRVPEAVAIAREAAGALVAAHEAGIVHGQLTPASLFINLDPTAGRGERVKLLDFGAAARTEEKQLDARTDCRALGEILFEMLCGTPPSLLDCAGEGQGADADAPPSPRSLNPDIPEPLDELISRALAPDQGSDRPFTTMADLRRALDSLAPGPVATPAPSAPAESAEAPSPVGTSAFDVPPLALPPAPVRPRAAVSSASGLPAWMRALVAPARQGRARTAASVALIALGVAVTVLSSRTHGTRAPERSPRRAATLPAVPPVTTKVPSARPDSPVPTPVVGPLAVPPVQGAAEELCSISIGSQPWSEIWIDGNRTGRHTPLVRYKVPCGRHTLTLRNPAQALVKSVVVTLKPHARFKKVFRLAGPAAAQE